MDYESTITSNNNEMFFNVQKKTDKEHILDTPDMYIGPIESIDSDMWIMNEQDKIIRKNIEYIPGLFKLFDEAIVNCRDHVVRMRTKFNDNVENAIPVSKIEINISEDGTISLLNDGNGIDVVKHPEHDIWIPEMIFGHLRTSTNYDKEEKKIVGGKNGYGFKLVLIWSSYGRIETVDHIRQLKYIQEFHNNLDIISPPKITKCTSKPYTRVIFKPDYNRIGITGLSADTLSLFKKRVYDISAVTDRTVRVKYNDSTIPVKNFEQYVNMYIGDKSDIKRVYESNENGRWEYIVAISQFREFTHVSFVNGINTSQGGKHVEYIINQITRKLSDLIEKKKKIKVNTSTIKEQIILFLRCDIENPVFDGQTKDLLKTNVSNFGSRCEVSDKFIEKVSKLGIMDTVCAITQINEQKVAKKSDGSKTRTIHGIPKLIDANWAGTVKSRQCILILTEGDSAKTGVLSGLSREHRDYIGVYPLKGKLLNVRGESMKNILDNDEISDIKKILGLEIRKEYKTIDDVNRYLRYGKVVFMTDQDPDGSHIKGLGINLFQHEWPSLFRISGFISYMNTAIIKARKGKNELCFYNNGEYQTWKNNNNTRGWDIHYYKGLGTSTKQEFTDYFKNPKFVSFNYEEENSDDIIDMVFNSKRAEDRKEWLSNVYDRDSYVDTARNNVSYKEFINKELIHFSKYDCDRSIANLMDGFKISTRKIIYCAFKRNLISRVKVAQFSGYVSENSCYHHGEASLNQAIIGLAQNFTGSNNINLLYPDGQFGSRRLGGKDAASPRYIFTKLENVTKHIFSDKDNSILNYLDDDGIEVEPQFYVPIVPMILVNGSMGIGTGFSSDIMCYNIIDIINYLKCKLTDDIISISPEFTPYYEGFKGDIIKISPSKYMFKGKYTEINENTINVTELPIGFWTENFKKLLDKLSNDKDPDGKRVTPIIKEFLDNSTVDGIDFTITFQQGKLHELKSNTLDNGCNELEKVLKLYTTNTTTNMNLFNHNDKLIKYTNVCDIIDDYYVIRLHYYELRKNKLIEILENELKILRNKSRYISELLDDIIDLRRKTEKQVYDMLSNSGYDLIEESFNYLTGMKMNSVCTEKVTSLNNEYLRKEEELNILKNTTIETMWINELNDLEFAYSEYLSNRKELIEENINLKKSKSAKSSKSLSSNKLNKEVPKREAPKKEVLKKAPKKEVLKKETTININVMMPSDGMTEDAYIESDEEICIESDEEICVLSDKEICDDSDEEICVLSDSE